jgi:hypothetical protein
MWAYAQPDRIALTPCTRGIQENPVPEGRDTEVTGYPGGGTEQ